MDETEASVMRRCRAGDKDAFGVLVKRYAGRAAMRIVCFPHFYYLSEASR